MVASTIFSRASATALLALGVSSVLQAATYTLVDLGAGVAKDINSSGRVVGNATSGAWHYDGTNRATLRFQTHFFGTPLDQLLFFTASTANGINDNGRIVGSVIFIPLQESTRKVYFTDDAQIATLIDVFGEGTGLNRNGVLVGGGAGLGFVLTGNNRQTAGGSTPFLSAINDGSVCVGSTVLNGSGVATSFSGTNFTQLSLANLNLPSTGNAADYESTATSVNNSGRIVGSVRRKTGAESRPRWGFVHANSQATDLGNLGGNIVSPFDINTDGRIVGSATIGDGSAHAFIHEDGVMSDLNLQVTGAFGWVLISANALNDSGMIVGEGRKDGVQRSFLLKPVGTPPSISSHPTNTRAFVGESITLRVAATGSPPVRYQWRHAGTNIPGAVNGSYFISAATTADVGTYSVVVSNDFGSVASNEATLEVGARDNSPLNLGVAMYAGIVIPGQVGRSYRIEVVDGAHDPTWEPVDTVLLTTSPHLWIDPDTTGHQARLYRAVPMP